MITTVTKDALEIGGSSDYKFIAHVSSILSTAIKIIDDLIDAGQSIEQTEHHEDHYFGDHCEGHLASRAGLETGIRISAGSRRLVTAIFGDARVSNHAFRLISLFLRRSANKV